MNDRNIEEIIGALYDMIQDARSMPLAADKCILERDKVLDMLDEIIAQMPSELKQARTIVENRSEIVAQAKREAENIVRKAQEEAEHLVSKEVIYEEAKSRCAEEIAQTKAQIASLRKISNEYMDDALRRTEEAIAQSLSEVQETRAKFNALTAAQAKSDSDTAE